MLSILTCAFDFIELLKNVISFKKYTLSTFKFQVAFELVHVHLNLYAQSKL